MTIDEAAKHCEEVAIEQDKLCKRYDDASGYSRSHNEAIRTTDAKRCEKCAEEHRQLAEWLRELKQLKEQEFYVTTRELSDDELKHLVEQMEKERWQFISVKQDPCDDAISRKAAIDAMIKIEQDDIDQYGCEIPEGFDSCQTAHYGRRFLRINFGVFAYPIVPRDFRLHGIIRGTARYRSLISAA